MLARLLYRIEIVGRVPAGPCVVAAKVRIVGTARALSRGRIGFPKLRLVVGEPIPVAAARPTVAAARELTRELEQRVDALR